jgi:hypothetical protein
MRSAHRTGPAKARSIVITDVVPITEATVEVSSELSDGVDAVAMTVFR